MDLKDICEGPERVLFRARPSEFSFISGLMDFSIFCKPGRFLRQTGPGGGKHIILKLNVLRRSENRQHVADKVYKQLSQKS